MICATWSGCPSPFLIAAPITSYRERPLSLLVPLLPLITKLVCILTLSSRDLDYPVTLPTSVTKALEIFERLCCNTRLAVLGSVADESELTELVAAGFVGQAVPGAHCFLVAG